MKINPQLSGTTNVLNLIREVNPRFTFDASLIKITNVVERVPDVVPYNTEAKVEGRNPIDNFFNPVHVYYNRRSMKEANPALSGTTNADALTTFDDLLTYITTELKLVKEEFEFVDFRTAVGSTVSVVTLKPIDNSQLYTPVTFDVTLAWQGSEAAALVPLLPTASKLHKLMNEKLPAPGYF